MAKVNIGMMQLPFMVYTTDLTGILTQIELELPDGLFEELRATSEAYFATQRKVRNHVEHAGELNIRDLAAERDDENQG